MKYLRILILILLTSCISENQIYFKWCPYGENNIRMVSNEETSTYIEGYVTQDENYYIYIDPQQKEHYISKRCLITGVPKVLDLYIMDYIEEY